MADPTRETDKEPYDRVSDERDDDQRFSQEDDDRAGRSWHGLNSEIDRDQIGRFEEDEDEETPRPGRTERI